MSNDKTPDSTQRQVAQERGVITDGLSTFATSAEVGAGLTTGIAVVVAAGKGAKKLVGKIGSAAPPSDK